MSDFEWVNKKTANIKPKTEFLDTFKSVYHYYPRIDFYLQRGGSDLVIKFTPIRNCRLTAKYLRLYNFRDYTAREVLSDPEVQYEYGALGRHFEDGILKVWKAFCLPLGFVQKVLREIKL